jgi:hypothetical protein
VILTDAAKVRGELRKMASVRCSDCRWVRSRVADLNAKIGALEAEAEEARRSWAFRDQADRLRDQRRADPVTARVAAWLGTSQVEMALLPALAAAVIVDGLASLCWLLVTQRHESRQPEESPTALVPPPPVTPVTPVAESVSWVEDTLDHQQCPSPGDPGSRGRNLDQLTRTVLQGLKAGALEKVTVVQIREYLRCSQETAAAIRREIASRKAGEREAAVSSA